MVIRCSMCDDARSLIVVDSDTSGYGECSGAVYGLDGLKVEFDQF